MDNDIRIKVPFAKEFTHSYDIDRLVNSINDLGSHPVLKAIEIGMYLHVYIGVFYIGRKPSKIKLQKIVKENLDIDPRLIKG